MPGEAGITACIKNYGVFVKHTIIAVGARINTGNHLNDNNAVFGMRHRELGIAAGRIGSRNEYYVLADISGLGYESARAAAYGLLEERGIAAVPGSAFFSGPDGERYLRFCYAKDEASLREAARRLRVGR